MSYGGLERLDVVLEGQQQVKDRWQPVLLVCTASIRMGLITKPCRHVWVRGGAPLGRLHGLHPAVGRAVGRAGSMGCMSVAAGWILRSVRTACSTLVPAVGHLYSTTCRCRIGAVDCGRKSPVVGDRCLEPTGLLHSSMCWCGCVAGSSFDAHMRLKSPGARLLTLCTIPGISR